jgi:hypothetical protein
MADDGSDAAARRHILLRRGDALGEAGNRHADVGGNELAPSLSVRPGRHHAEPATGASGLPRGRPIGRSATMSAEARRLAGNPGIAAVEFDAQQRSAKTP